MASCGICCEGFNRSARKPVECGRCELSACVSCTKTFLLDSVDAKCMGCKVVWEREFLDAKLPKTFLNGELKKHRADVLLEREKSLMPETIPYVEQRREGERLNKEASVLYASFKTLQTRMRGLTGKDPEYRTVKAATEAAHVAYTEKTWEVYRVNHPDAQPEEKKERREFVRGCPAEGCRGFLSSQWKCGICDVWACKDCHEIIGADKDAPHTCDPGNVETAKLLAKDSKPCPKCAAMIFKVVGCDQMYCTQCHTPFSWKTGEVETGRIHNPHYFEYQRRVNGGRMVREIGDEVCGGMPNVHAIVGKPLYRVDNEKILQVFHTHAHLLAVEVPRMNGVADNRDLRIAYLLNEIDEDSLKTKVIKRDKLNAKKAEQRLVFQMSVDTITEIVRRMARLAKTEEEVKAHLAELDALRDYTQECLDKIASRYMVKSAKVNWW